MASGWPVRSKIVPRGAGMDAISLRQVPLLLRLPGAGADIGDVKFVAERLDVPFDVGPALREAFELSLQRALVAAPAAGTLHQ